MLSLELKVRSLTLVAAVAAAVVAVEKLVEQLVVHSRKFVVFLRKDLRKELVNSLVQCLRVVTNLPRDLVKTTIESHIYMSLVCSPSKKLRT